MSQDSWLLARHFFSKIVDRFQTDRPARIGVLTHLLPDRPAFLQALADLGRVEWVVPIRYSEWPGVASQIEKLGIEVRRPSAETAWPPPPNWFQSLLDEAIESDPDPFVLSEIGGYFASSIAASSARAPSRLLGVVEDTEGGHRIYAEHAPLPVPVYSIARSPLKTPEDTLVGESIAFSVEGILRELDRPLRGTTATVLGYGSVGSATATALASRGAHVAVWDTDPSRRIVALAAGFATPERKEALEQAELILGATGSVSLDQADLKLLPSGCVLASGSSRQTEFALEPSKRSVIAETPYGVPLIETLRTSERSDLYLAYSGFPVNFADGASLGPFLQLAQAEIVAAVSSLMSSEIAPGLQELPAQTRTAVANHWIASFMDMKRGIVQGP